MQDSMPPSSAPDKDARLWGMLCHLSAFAGFVVPFGSIVAPLVIWLIKKDEIPFVDDQGKESINFQITIFLAFIVSALLMFVLIGFFLIFAVAIFDIIMIIIASVKANEGMAYRYPYSLRLIK